MEAEGALKISIIGTGVVGKATGRGFERLGHDVRYFDKGKTFESADILFICVPEDIVENVVDLIVMDSVQGLKVIRSTVLPGTTQSLQKKTAAYNHICHNPEFFREAVSDYEFMNPDRVVIGECCKEHGNLLEELYKPIRAPIVRVDPATSEMIKLASNAYLATQISFWNEIEKFCRKLGVNSHMVGKACALDHRISGYGASMHGQPYGGRCLPKDVLHLIESMKKHGVSPLLLSAVHKINEDMKHAP